MKHLPLLLHSGHTVFTYDYLRDILGIADYNLLKYTVKQLLKNNVFQALHGGVWWFHNYNKLELAAKLKSPSYISLETVLQKEAVIFQDYSAMTTLVRTNSLELKVQGHLYKYRKMKEDLLLNPLGIMRTPTYAIATKERAICDMLYYVSDYYFDNINELHVELMEKLAPQYPQTTQKAIYSLLDDYAQHQ